MTIVDSPAPPIAGVFLCPCGRLAIRWADLDNDRCPTCTAAR